MSEGNKIKHCRRVATRYDKLAANYRAFVQLAYLISPHNHPRMSVPLQTTALMELPKPKEMTGSSLLRAD